MDRRWRHWNQDSFYVGSVSYRHGFQKWNSLGLESRLWTTLIFYDKNSIFDNWLKNIWIFQGISFVDMFDKFCRTVWAVTGAILDFFRFFTLNFEEIIMVSWNTFVPSFSRWPHQKVCGPFKPNYSLILYRFLFSLKMKWLLINLS